MRKIKVFTDGASRGNPGEAGIGIIIYDENDFIIESHKEYLGKSTNNQAEYKALIKSLDLIKKILENEGNINTVEFYSDSELMVNQINFDYLVKEPELAILNNKFHVKAKKMGLKYVIQHVDRYLNKAADRLANKAIDGKKKIRPQSFTTQTTYTFGNFLLF
ncbi:MAG: ribonuclease HI family protein [Chlorobi bacterium]|nr:ribonuclease HI family protein [Chlorobiota bacterium]MCI0715923.1 ribonuclease HI family protein [Chlorobiota bacterium]